MSIFIRWFFVEILWTRVLQGLLFLLIAVCNPKALLKDEKDYYFQSQTGRRE